MPELDVDDATLAYETHGNGRPLLFLHGAWVDGAQWTPQVDRFAEDFEVVTPDLRGHGGSTGGDGLGVDRMAEDVAALCDALGLERPVVCGLSLGGLVAQRLALARPDRLAGLVLADTVRSVPPVGGSEATRRALFPAAPARALARLMGPSAYFQALLAALEASGGPWLALDDDARQYALDRVAEFDTENFLAVLDAFRRHRPADLADLAVETLIVYGDHEPVPVRAQNRAMARDIQDATLEVVPDAAHLSNRDNPAAFGDLLKGFIADRAAVFA